MSQGRGREGQAEAESLDEHFADYLARVVVQISSNKLLQESVLLTRIR